MGSYYIEVSEIIIIKVRAANIEEAKGRLLQMIDDDMLLVGDLEDRFIKVLCGIKEEQL